MLAKHCNRTLQEKSFVEREQMQLLLLQLYGFDLIFFKEEKLYHLTTEIAHNFVNRWEVVAQIEYQWVSLHIIGRRKHEFQIFEMGYGEVVMKRFRFQATKSSQLNTLKRNKCH